MSQEAHPRGEVRVNLVAAMQRELLSVFRLKSWKRQTGWKERDKRERKNPLVGAAL
jgi:uncharacterized protein YjcR